MFFMIFFMASGFGNGRFEQRNVDISTIETKSQAVVGTSMENEFDRWFVDLYAPPRLVHANELTTENTTTSAYLGFDLEFLDDKNRAQWMFPRHLNTKDFQVITVLKKDLPAWKQHVLDLDGSAFDIPSTEEAQSGKPFGKAYARDPAKHTVKRTSIRMVMGTSAPSGERDKAGGDAYKDETKASAAFATFKENKDVVYRRRSMEMSKYDDSMRSKTTTMEQLPVSTIKTELNKDALDKNIDEIRSITVADGVSVPAYIVDSHDSHTNNGTKYYFEHDDNFRYVFSHSAAKNKLEGVLTEDTITKKLSEYYFEVTGSGQTAYYWFETTDMYETLVPSCKTDGDTCKSCYVSSNETLTDDDLKACTNNFNTLMGIINGNEEHLKQCNRHKRGDLPGVIWPMYAWTLQVLRMPTKYFNLVKSGIYVSVQDHIPAGATHSIGDVTDGTKDIDVQTFDHVTRSQIAYGKMHAVLDTDKKNTLCMVPQTLGANRVHMNECVAGEQVFRNTARNGGIVLLFVGVLIYTFVGLFVWGSLGHLFGFNADEKTKKKEENRIFPLQYFSETRPQAEITQWLPLWGLEKWQNAANWISIVVLVVLFVSILIVLFFVSLLLPKIGPSCGLSGKAHEELFAMYTSEGKDAQSYVKNTVAFPFVFVSWFVVVVLVLGAVLNIYENGRTTKTPGDKENTPGPGQSNMYMAIPNV